MPIYTCLCCGHIEGFETAFALCQRRGRLRSRVVCILASLFVARLRHFLTKEHPSQPPVRAFLRRARQRVQSRRSAVTAAHKSTFAVLCKSRTCCFAERRSNCISVA